MPNKLKIAVIDDMEELRELLVFLISSEMNAEIDEFHSGNTAIAAMKDKGPYDIIISDIHMPGGSGKDVLNFLKMSGWTTPIIFLSGSVLDEDLAIEKSEQVHRLAKPFRDIELIELLNKIITQSLNKNKTTNPAQEYIPVKLSLLRKVLKIQTPLFVKINEEKFVKMTSQPSTFDDPEMLRYLEKGLSHLYIKAEDAQNFIADFSKQTLSAEAWASINPNESTDLIRLNTELLKVLAESLGWSDELVNVAKENTHKALLLAKGHPKLQATLHQFQKIERFGYADHCTLLVLVASGMANLMGHRDEETLRKLTFAALFHDIGLTEMQFDSQSKYLRQIHQGAPLTSKDLKDVYSHPERAAEICRQWSFCPSEVDQIILDHHEQADGTGFPRKKSALEVNMLSALFIIAEDLVSFYSEHLGRIELHQFIQHREANYAIPPYSIIFEALKQSAV